MINDITEFSFAYAFTEEFIRAMDNEIDFAPYIPNLREEGESAYDLKLSWGIPLFFQFKLSEYLKVLGPRVQEFSRGYYTTGFYRIELRTKGDQKNQHNRLVSLNEEGEFVNYVAPIFWEMTRFNEFYRNRQIIENSFLVPPKEIGKYSDGKTHRISFQSMTSFYSFSEPKFHEGKFDFEHFLKDVQNKIAANKKNQIKIDEEYWVRLEDTMLRIIQDDSPIKNGRIFYNKNASQMERIKFLSRSYFNCEMFMAKAKEEAII